MFVMKNSHFRRLPDEGNDVNETSVKKGQSEIEDKYKSMKLKLQKFQIKVENDFKGYKRQFVTEEDEEHDS